MKFHQNCSFFNKKITCVLNNRIRRGEILLKNYRQLDRQHKKFFLCSLKIENKKQYTKNKKNFSKTRISPFQLNARSMKIEIVL